MYKLASMVKSAAIVCAIAFSGAPQAAVDCTGTITNLSLQMNSVGVVTLSLSGGPSYVYLCYVDGTANGVSPAVCKTMYATLMAAKIANKQVLIRFYDHSSCSAIPAWANAGTLGWTQVLVD